MTIVSALVTTIGASFFGLFLQLFKVNANKNKAIKKEFVCRKCLFINVCVLKNDELKIVDYLLNWYLTMFKKSVPIDLTVCGFFATKLVTPNNKAVPINFLNGL
jgi:hypothetical protein